VEIGCLQVWQYSKAPESSFVAGRRRRYWSIDRIDNKNIFVDHENIHSKILTGFVDARFMVRFYIVVSEQIIRRLKESDCFKSI